MSISPDQLHADRQLRLADWHEFPLRPAVERGGEVYELPQPITNFAIKDSWDGERFKTLLVDGDTTVGTTRNGVDITLFGEIGSEAGDVALTRAEMLAALEELRARLHVGLDDDKFRFYLYRDVESETYRFFESCTTTRLETDLTNPQAFRFELVIHADDPTIYEALPEEE